MIAAAAFALSAALPLQKLLEGIGGRGSLGRARLLELHAKGVGDPESASREISRLITLRSRRGIAKYYVFSVSEGGVSRSYVMIEGVDARSLDVEVEVFKTLVSAVTPGVRVLESPLEPPHDVQAFLSGLPSRGRESTLILDLESPSGGVQPAGFSIGRSVEGGTEVIIGERDVEGHIGVFGSTGGGKSSTLSLIIAGAAWSLGMPVLVLDWSGEFPGLLSRLGVEFEERDPTLGGYSINPLDLGGGLDHVVSLMVSSLSLTPPQAYVLYRVLEGGNIGDLAELEEAIGVLPEESGWEREVKRALQRKISMLTRGSERAFSETRVEPFDGVMVVRVDRILSVLARRSYATFITAKTYMDRALGVAEGRLLVVLDEAHNFLAGEGGNVFLQALAESRKHGLYLAVASQSPSAVNNGVLLNTNTKIVHVLRSYRDKSVIADSMGLPKRLAESLDRLPPGEAVIQSPSYPKPVHFKVEFPYG